MRTSNFAKGILQYPLYVDTEDLYSRQHKKILVLIRAG